jgi:ligand-binding SRPBCC domain-containing protein
MMRSKLLHSEIWIAAPPERVRDYIADGKNFLVTHPLIIAVDELPRLPEDGPNTRRYQITDRLRMLGLSFRLRYLTVMAVTPNGGLITDAYQAGVHLHAVYQFTPENGGTQLIEDDQIDVGIDLLMGYVYGTTRRAHDGMLARLKQAVEVLPPH